MSIVKNSFYFRSICGVLSLATLLHSLSEKKQVVQPSYELNCANKANSVAAFVNTSKYLLACTTKIQVIKFVNKDWVLVKTKNKEYLVQSKNIRELENHANYES